MRNIKKMDWIFSIVIFLGVFLSFLYIDLTSLTIWSTNIWDCVFGEGLNNYYSYSSLNLNQIEHSIMGNDLLIYFPWAIWNFPIWLIAKATGITISTNSFMLLYSKLFLVVIFIGVLFVTYKICSILKMEKTRIQQVLFLTISSAFALTAIAYAGQNDILPIFFFMLGLLYLLKGKQIPFFVFAAVSMAMKPYLLFSFIIIILLVEKKVLKCLVKISAGISVFVLQKIILNNFPYHQDAMNSGAADGEIELLLKAKIQIAQYEVSVFAFLLVFLAILVYFSKPKKEELGIYIVYYATVPILLMFAVSGYSFYRPIYLIPLLYIMIASNKKIPIYFQLFLEMALVVCMYYQFLRAESLFYNPYYLNKGLIGSGLHIEIPKGLSFQESLARMNPNIGYYFSISSAVIIVLIAIIIIINHPKFNKKIELETWVNTHFLFYIRLFYMIVLIAIAMSGLIILK